MSSSKEKQLDQENQDLKYQIFQMENQLTDQSDKYQTLNEEYDKLKSQFEQYVKSTDDVVAVDQDEIKRLQEKIDGDHRNSQRIKTEANKFHEDNQSLLTSYSQLESAFNKQQEQIEHLKHNEVKQQKDIQGLQKELKMHERQNKVALEESEQKRHLSGKQNQTVIDLKGQNAGLQQQLDQEQIEKKLLEESLEMAQNQLKQRQENRQSLAVMETQLQEKKEKLRLRYEDKLDKQKKKMDKTVRDKVAEYKNEIDRLESMVNSADNKIEDNQDENLRAIDILQRSLQHTSYHYLKQNQIIMKLNAPVETAQINPLAFTVQLFTNLNRKTQSSVLDIKNNKVCVYKEQGKSGNVTKYKFDEVMVGMQQLSQCQEDRVSLLGKHIHIVYGHSNSGRQRVLEHGMFTLLNKSRLYINCQQLVSPHKHFLLKIKLSSYQAQHLDILLQDKRDSTRSPIDQDYMTNMISRLTVQIGKHQDKNLLLKLSILEEGQCIARHKTVMSEIIHLREEGGLPPFSAYLSSLLQSVAIAKSHLNTHAVNWIFCVDSAQKTGLIIQDTLKSLLNPAGTLGNFNLQPVKHKVQLKQDSFNTSSQNTHALKSTLLSAKGMLLSLQNEAKRFQKLLLDNRNQDNQYKIRKITAVMEGIKTVKELLESSTGCEQMGTDQSKNNINEITDYQYDIFKDQSTIRQEQE